LSGNFDCPARVHPEGSRVQMGDIVRAHGAALRAACVLTPTQHAVIDALARCRTAALGGHLAVCNACGHATPVYNSCRNRHCPTCQCLDQHRWIEQRQQRILPTGYFHLVFTLPEGLRTLVLYNRKALFAMLFSVASQTLLTLARDPRHLGAMPAITLVLHTWTRELLFHPHVHAIMSAGGLSPDGTRWVPSRKNYLFPVKVISKLFRLKFRAALIEALASGTVCLPPDGPPDVLDRLRDALGIQWVVYAKAPFGSAEKVYQYLGRYTHRVGISNARICSMDARGVTFATKDGRTVTLDGVEFLRRFVQHVLPKGFTKLRHYGLLAPCHATTTLEHARALLEPATQAPILPTTLIPDGVSHQSWIECLLALTGLDATRCPRCKTGRLVRRPLDAHRSRPAPQDTS